jgi:hypothetical protein
MDANAPGGIKVPSALSISEVVLTMLPLSYSVDSKPRHELVMVVAGVALAISLQLIVSRAGSLFTRHFWLDEFYTHALVADPSVGNSMKALAAGVETHPPALYLSLRAFTALIGRRDELAFRMFAFLSAMAALLGIYRTLRLTFPVWASVAGIMAVWAHQVMQRQSFESRFYVPWLAAIVWYCYFLVRSRDTRDLLLWLGIAATAAYACTVHYFGIITLALVLGAELLWRLQSRRPLASALIPSLAGPLALACCLPMLWEQRHATTLSSWMKDPEAENVISLISEIYAEAAIGMGVAIAWLGTLFSPPAMTVDRSDLRVGGQMGLSALLLLPVVLIVFSYVVQPALVPRYSLPAVAGLAPAVAWLYVRLSWRWALVTNLIFLGQGGWQLHEEARLMRTRDDQTRNLIHTLEERTDSELILYESPGEQYLVSYYAPRFGTQQDLLRRSYLIDFEKGDLKYEPASRIFVRDLARQYAKFYSPPAIMKWSDFRSQYTHAYLVPAFLRIFGDNAWVKTPYPGFNARKLTDQLYELSSENNR